MNRRNILWGSGAVLAAAGAGGLLSYAGMGSAAEQVRAAEALRTPLSAPADIQELVRYATLAANSHNTQPWRFVATAGGVEIHPDFSRRTPVVDPQDHHLFISLGCAAENLALAAAAQGRPTEPRFDPAGDGRLLCDFGSGAAATSPLFDAIPARQSTRNVYDGRAIDPADLATLAAAAAIPGVETALITDRQQIAGLRDLILAANDRQVADPAFRQELMHWLRFNPAQAMATKDGLYSVSSGNPALPGWIAPTLFDMVFTQGAENDRYRQQIDSAAGIAVFFAATDDADHWTRVGRAFQRFALQATALDIKTAHLNQPIETGMRRELGAAAGQAAALPLLCVRFGRAPAMPYSLRRSVREVLA
ncbi:MAG: Tat pathway signal protein [Mesorhizobium sp.]|nr:Tat pathway signal protein [Mesorhizobium sp.]